ncbi:MAG: hypothetical protein QOD96_7409 [Pseudonocardiales bacterium]|jgi:hypothetical protein|nr:hypothetical protein [Pseudonocardiales bacterium]
MTPDPHDVTSPWIAVLEQPRAAADDGSDKHPASQRHRQ